MLYCAQWQVGTVQLLWSRVRHTFTPEPGQEIVEMDLHHI